MPRGQEPTSTPARPSAAAARVSIRGSMPCRAASTPGRFSADGYHHALAPQRGRRTGMPAEPGSEERPRSDRALRIASLVKQVPLAENLELEPDGTLRREGIAL